MVAVLGLAGLALHGSKVSAAEIVVEQAGPGSIQAIHLTPNAPVIWFGQALSIQDGLVHTSGFGVRFHVGQLRSLSGGASADGLADGDFVALIDMDRLVVAATWLTQQDLKDGGIVR